jgi:hypothetical protein
LRVARQRIPALGDATVTLARQRIIPLLAGHEVVVVNGAGERPHGKTMLQKLRDSYAP